MKALVCPVVTYGCESWTLRKNEETRLEDCKMKGLRKILMCFVGSKEKKLAGSQQSWSKEGITVRYCQSEEASILWSHHGHTMRKQGDCLEKEIMQGTMPGVHRRGRPRTAWIDNIKSWTGLSLEESIRMTEDRDKGDKWSTSMVWPTLGPRTVRNRNKNCGQTAGWIKMSFGTEVGLGPGHIVLNGNPTPSPK